MQLTLLDNEPKLRALDKRHDVAPCRAQVCFLVSINELKVGSSNVISTAVHRYAFQAAPGVPSFRFVSVVLQGGTVIEKKKQGPALAVPEHHNLITVSL